VNYNCQSAGPTIPLVVTFARGRNPVPPSLGYYIKTGVSVCGVLSSTVSFKQQINLHQPASSFLAGHLNDTSLQHLPGLLGARRSRGTEERILSAADGGFIALAAVGESSAQPLTLRRLV
jgi:hypothetical protein